jgi:hypothetical protein
MNWVAIYNLGNGLKSNLQNSSNKLKTHQQSNRSQIYDSSQDLFTLLHGCRHIVEQLELLNSFSSSRAASIGA